MDNWENFEQLARNQKFIDYWSEKEARKVLAAWWDDIYKQLEVNNGTTYTQTQEET